MREKRFSLLSLKIFESTDEDQTCLIELLRTPKLNAAEWFGVRQKTPKIPNAKSTTPLFPRNEPNKSAEGYHSKSQRQRDRYRYKERGQKLKVNAS